VRLDDAGPMNDERGSSRPRVAGIVLAGGRASRFGRDKLAERLDGRTLVDRAIASLEPVVDLVVVAGPHDATRRIPAHHGVPGGSRRPRLRTADPVPDGGPVVGLATALEVAADNRASAAVVVGGDMPWLRPVVLERLLVELEAAEAVVAVETGSWRPLPLALRVAPALDAAREHLASGGRDLFGLLRRLRVRTLEEAVWRPIDPGGATFRDIDRPMDLR